MAAPGSPLSVPIVQSQIDAANRLHAQLTQWVVTDNALLALATAFPQWSPEASLLKVAAVNQLYSTNLYAIIRMAEHVAYVMSCAHVGQEGPELVERLATLPKSPEQKKQWHHYSFASKLAHFFVSDERFPIYDSYAVQMVEYHLGPKERLRDLAHPYQAYVANLELLRERSGLIWAGRELDRYLWLAGQYRTWQRNANAVINTELARLFNAPSAEALVALTILLPPQ